MATKPIAHNVNSKWRSQDVKIQETADFSSLLLSSKVLAGLKQAGYQSPSPIQIEAIPIGRFGKDLVVQAKSGTGKTLVFSIIALEMILTDVTQPQVLIIAPTREIAHQICSVIQAVGSAFENLNCATFIGGTSVAEDKENVSGCQIAVGTPGRLKQLIKEGALKTNCIRLFVLDEADQLLETSFQSDVDEIFMTLPKDKQVIATSATYPQELKKLAGRYFRNPYLARLNIDELALLGIVHYVQAVDVPDMPLLVYKHKLEYLAKILTSISFSQCLVFCNQLSRVPVLTSDIKDWGFSTTSISSEKEQADRLKAIDKLKLFKCKVLVSSNLTARGIDAENVNLVVNFDLPHNTETYLHRVGRAGRYGSRGLAVTLVLPKESETYKMMQSSANFSSYDLPDPIPQNLMNIRPQGFQGNEDGFEPSSEKSELKSKCKENGNTEDSIEGAGESNGTESTGQRQNEESDGREDINSESIDTDDCLVQNKSNYKKKNKSSKEYEKIDYFGRGKVESVGSDACQEQNKSSSKNGSSNDGNKKGPNDKIQNELNLEKQIKSSKATEKTDCFGSPTVESVVSDVSQEQNELSAKMSENKSENPSTAIGNEKEISASLNNSSPSDEKSTGMYADVASFLAQMQPIESLDNKESSPSDSQSKENLDGFYYQVFKSFAEESMPNLVPDVHTSDTSDNAVTAVENKPSEIGAARSIEVEELFDNRTHSGSSILILDIVKEKEYLGSSSESDDSEVNLEGSDGSSVCDFIPSSSITRSSDSEPSYGEDRLGPLCDPITRVKNYFSDPYYARARGGLEIHWNESTPENESTLNVPEEKMSEPSYNHQGNHSSDQVFVYSHNNQVSGSPFSDIEEQNSCSQYEHLSESYPEKGLEGSGSPCNPSSAGSGKVVKSLPIFPSYNEEDGRSQSKSSQSSDSHSPNYQGRTRYPHRGLECNSSHKSGKDVKSVPISPSYYEQDDRSQSKCSQGPISRSSGSQRRSKKRQEHNHSQSHQTREQGYGSHSQNCLLFGQAHNHCCGFSPAYPVCSGNVQPEVNLIYGQFQEAFNSGYNLSCVKSSNLNCHHQISHPTCSHGNYCQFPQNTNFHSCSHDSLFSNMWYDMFSRQWQHINNMCFFP